jgi:hypothetical protein
VRRFSEAHFPEAPTSVLFTPHPHPALQPSGEQSENSNRQYDSKFKTTIMNSTTCKHYNTTIGLIRGSKQSITLAEFKSAFTGTRNT